MANTYISTGSTSVGTTDSILYSAGVSTTAIVKSLYLSNTSTGTYYVTVSTDLENSGTKHILLESGEVPMGSTLQVIDGAVVLNSRASVYVHASEASAIHVTAAILEIS